MTKPEDSWRMFSCRWCGMRHQTAECFLCPRCKKPLCSSCHRCQGDGHILPIRKTKMKPTVQQHMNNPVASDGASRKAERERAAERRRAAAAAYAEQARHMVSHAFADPSAVARAAERPVPSVNALHTTTPPPGPMAQGSDVHCIHGMDPSVCHYCARPRPRVGSAVAPRHVGAGSGAGVHADGSSGSLHPGDREPHVSLPVDGRHRSSQLATPQRRRRLVARKLASEPKRAQSPKNDSDRAVDRSPLRVGQEPVLDRRTVVWFPIPWNLPELLRLRSFPVLKRSGYVMVQSRNDPPDNLLKLRLSDGGQAVARVAGNSPVGKTRSYQKSSKRSASAIERVLRNSDAAGDAGRLVAALEAAESDLHGARKKFATPSNRSRRGVGVVVVSGGLPSLGKRR